jgi:sugar lactone lactonase YvrE
LFVIAAMAMPGCGNADKKSDKDKGKAAAKTDDAVADKKGDTKKDDVKKDDTLPAGDKAEDKAAAKPLKQTELLVELPDHCNTPDGMALLADGSVIISVPNFNDKSAEPLLVKITPDNKLEDFLKLPKHPVTGRMGPMGVRAAPDGSLFLADNQLFHGEGGKNLLGLSRLVRIPMQDGKPGEIEIVAENMNVANGITIHDGYVYITETQLEPEAKPLVSGLMRFKLDERNVKLKQPLKDDPHVIATFTSTGKLGFGADGVCFDHEGNLYVNCFEDAWIRKLKLDKDGKVVSNEVFVEGGLLKSCDGMDFDPKTKKIYMADMVSNAVMAVGLDGKVEVLASSPDGDGSGGALESPCEALVRGDTIVVANMDFLVGGVNQQTEKPHTISVIKLK